MKKGIHSLLLLMLLCLGSVQAKVYQVIGTAEGRLNTVGLPWEFAYRTIMAVNGQQNDLHVYSARFSEPVVDQLTDQFERQGAKVTISETRNGAQGVAKWNDREARILVLSPSSQPNQMVFLFYPQPGKIGAPDRLPVPEYPGGMSKKIVTNESTGSICATMDTEDMPEQVLTYYAGTLSAQGWKAVLPLETGAGRMAIYRKRERICTVLASHRSDGPNRVTLLVKGGGL